MDVKKDALIAELAQKLKKDVKWIEKELAALVKEIKTQTAAGKPVEIEKFGTFSEKSGRLSFDINETFALEINYKYAGMEPIELAASYEERGDEEEPSKPETGKEKEEDIEEVLGLKDTKGKTEKKSEEEKPAAAPSNEKKKEQPVKARQDKKSDKSEDERRWEETFGITDPDLSETFTPSLSEKSAKDSGEKDDKDKKPSPPAPKPAVVESKPKIEPDDKKTVVVPSYNRHKQSNTSQILVMILGAAVIIAGAVYLIFPGILHTSSEPVVQKVVVQKNQPSNNTVEKPAPVTQSNPVNSTAGSNNTAGKNSVAAATTAGNTRAQSDVKEKNEIIADLKKASGYGLKGNGLSPRTDFYGIVLYSLTDVNRAQTQKSKLSGLGYRAFVEEAQVNGKQMWRVGVGQFPDVKSAQKAVGQLSDPYRTQNFIKYIHVQTNQ